MKILQNLHTHSKYCDGADTLEEMIAAAIEKGFDSIGFSSHSPMYWSELFKFDAEGVKRYKKEIGELKDKYKGKIKIFCGLEVDIYSEVDLDGFDYLIGSVHYFNIDGKFFGFDRTAEAVKKLIDEQFGGNGLEYAKKYYKSLACLPEYGKFDIIGHFDLITKHSDNVKFFDEESKEYKNAAIEAAEALSGKIEFFEVNTGAIARGYRKTPYPSPFIAKELKRLGFKAVITSDCHDRRMLDCEFSQAQELLKACGFREHYILTENGFKGVEF